MMSRFVNRLRLEMEQLEGAAAPGAAPTPSATQLVASGLGIRIAFGQGEPPTQPPAPLNEQQGQSQGQGQGQGGPADMGDIEAGMPTSPAASLTVANGTDSAHSRAGGESAAQAAARQRLAHPESLDMAHIAVWVDGMLPYLLLFIVVFLNAHFVQLIQLVWLFACLLKVNPMVRKAWTKQEDALHQALMGMAYIVVSLWACLYLTGGFPLLHCLSFLPVATTPESLTITLMTVGIVDCIARLLFALVKLPILLACRFWPKDIMAVCGLRPARTGNAAARARIRQQGALLSLIDMLANCYRMLLPVQFWYVYLLYRSDKYPMIASSLTGLYVTRKGVDVWQALWKLLSVLRNLWQTGHSYGRPATREDILAAGNQCPICQDTISGGLRLSCNHCFCEDCIAEWLERDTTCPMCRTQVKAADTASSSSDQALAMSLLPRLF